MTTEVKTRKNADDAIASLLKMKVERGDASRLAESAGVAIARANMFAWQVARRGAAVLTDPDVVALHEGAREESSELRWLASELAGEDSR